MMLWCVVCDEGEEANFVYKGHSLCRECFAEYQEDEKKRVEDMEQMVSSHIPPSSYIDVDKLKEIL